jgi:hypothetical protein
MSGDNTEAGAPQIKGEHVKTFPELDSLVKTFYTVLPGKMVGSFQKEIETKNLDDIAKFKKRIDLGQKFFEEFEGLRMQTGNFTAEELDKLTIPQLQVLAKSFGQNPKRVKAELVASLTGAPKSIPATQSKYWNKDGKCVLVQRLREARDAVNYPHPRQALAAEKAAMRAR